MYYKFIKLVNGENIIATTEDICESFKDKEYIDIRNVIAIIPVRVPRGDMILESYFMQPWIKMGMNEMKLPVSSILIATDLQEVALNQYEEYINGFAGEEIEDQQADIQNDDSLVEKFYSALTNESNDNDEFNEEVNYDTRTIH